MTSAKWHWPLMPFLVTCMFGQSAAPAFEVASVKRNPAGQGANTRMNGSPESMRYTAVPLQWIIAEAYGVPFYQVSGPDWVKTESYDIIAKSAPGTPAGQKKEMLKSLLAERFHLKAHRETRDIEAVVMTVAKGGPKMHRSDQPAGGYRITQDGAIRHMKVYAAMKALAPMLAGMLREPVVDRTELSGVFDIAIDWDVSVPAETLDNLLRAAQGQLGLRAERKKVPMELVIVDQADKVPVEN
jgi:uncharacterized protein (TIGR03435 family)